MTLVRQTAFLLVLLTLGFTVCAADDSRPILRLAAADDFPPFYFKDEAGEFQGISYEVVTIVCNRLGYDIEFQQLANMRTLLSELETGQQDLAINLTATAERLNVALFTSTPQAYESQNLIVRADSSITYNGTLLEIARYRLGLNFGWTYGPQFNNAKFLQKAYVNDSLEQLRWLLAGRFDIAVNNPQFFNYTASQIGVSRAFRVLEPAIFTLPVTVGVSRKYPDAKALVAKLDREIARFRQEDAYQDILRRYGFERREESKDMTQ